ncbi:MarR family transcriptional regulator [Bacillus halotolerans]|uniref:MarR family transcriptional regulator n=1 Tax=Bacillus halotolerans TaxID=260554 RepID=UPI000D029E75|nr:MarR family transcriptional regulator [Bacillus halotolerans]PRS06849.1 MarR family transcriptional regulator [Bacillus halotolerans]PRS25697.1 MarR family transcriptional regulator [Bacillus halotolerans]QKS06141.1 MarR family transcriptional regulator [Bacillus halotolerans]
MSGLTKQLIYDIYVRLLHLNEQKANTSLQQFFKEAAEEDVIDVPKNITSIHVVDCIGQHEPINNTGIAKKMNLSKANVTKISTKLIKEEFINRYQLSDNKKEVYFKLTRKGRQIFDLHEKLHKKKELAFYQFLDSFSQDEQNAVLKFLEQLTSRLEAEQTDDASDKPVK